MFTRTIKTSRPRRGGRLSRRELRCSDPSCVTANGLIATCVLSLKREMATLLLKHDKVGTFPSNQSLSTLPCQVHESRKTSYDILFPLNDKFPCSWTYTNTRYPYFYCGLSMVHRALKRCKVAAVQLSQRVKFFCPSDFGVPYFLCRLSYNGLVEVEA